MTIGTLVKSGASITGGQAVVVLVALVATGTAFTQSRGASKDSGQGSYSEDQARRGKGVFAKSCSHCHTVDSTATPTRIGERIPLLGQEFMAKWRTVGDLFSKTRSTMPADRQGELHTDEFLDVDAYLLQVNGLPAGNEDLRADMATLHALLLDEKLVRRQVVANDVSTGAFYSDEQAHRGQAYFLGNCATCHTANSGAPTDADLAMGRRGALVGNYRVMSIATGPSRWQRYPDVFALFNKIRRSMPAHDPDGLSMETYLAITAYVLQVNGAPAGEHDLAYSENGMKSMMLNEPGFEKLFNGRDFTGIKFVVGTNCRQKDAGCNQSELGRPFNVEDGAIICSGAPQGYWYTDRKYLNFTLRFDYRYMRPKDLQDDRDFIGNSGYFLFVTENQVWPRMLQMEGGFANALAPAPLGGTAKFTQDPDARKRATRPLNEWNAVEIVSKDGKVTGYLNGTLVSTVTEHDFKEAGYIGFQSEGGEIHWRNIRIKAE